MTKLALHAQHLTKVYEDNAERIEVLRDVNLALPYGQMLAIMGASGSGKSTLLHVLGLLDVPTSGSVSIAGSVGEGLSETKKSTLRNQSLGFVYQFHHLLPEFSALDNVAMPLIVRRLGRTQAREQALIMLNKVGLKARQSHFPSQLSGGERQRVALARALVTRPVCILADEPTGNLDRSTAYQMFDLIRTMNSDFHTAFIIVTHDPELASCAHRQLTMEKGVLQD